MLTKGLILTSFRASDLKKSQGYFHILVPEPVHELIPLRNVWILGQRMPLIQVFTLLQLHSMTKHTQRHLFIKVYPLADEINCFFSIYDCTRELSQIKNSHSILKYKMPSASVFTDWTNLSPVVSISIWICWEEFVYPISEKLMSSNDTLNLWGHHRSLSKADERDL